MCLVEAVKIHIIEEGPEKARIRAGWVWREGRERERGGGEEREPIYCTHTVPSSMCEMCVGGSLTCVAVVARVGCEESVYC